MDMESIRASAIEYETGLAMKKAREEYYEELRAKQEEEENKPLLEKIGDTVNDWTGGKFGENVRNAMGEVYGPGSEDMNPTTFRPLGKIEDVISEIPGDFVNAATEVGKTRQNFWHNVSNMQQAYLDAQETGDFSGFNKAVDDTRNAGREASVALANVMASPVRSAARNFIKLNADNPASPYQSLAQSLQMTDVGIEYFTTDAEHLQKSREIEEALGLPPESTLADNAAFKEALEMYYFKQKYDNIEYVWEEYPELKNIASMDKEAAAIALHNIHTVKESHSTIDTFMTFLGKGNRELELNNIQFKIAEGKATDEEIKRAEELKKEIAQDKAKAPGFFQDPLGAMAAGVAESLPEMGQSVAGGVAGGGAAATAITLAAVAATVLTGGTDLLVAGGIAGARAMIMRALASQGGKYMLKTWATTGAMAGMYAPEEGQRYGEYKEMKKKDGTPLYTDEQARYYASAGAAANTFLEIVPTFAVAGKALPVATRVFQQSAKSIVRQSLGRETLKDIGVAAAGNWLKITATESGEESLQSAADDVIRNIALESKGKDADHYQQYSAGDILTRAGAAFVESLPASMAFGFAGVGGSAVVGAGRVARSRKRAAEMENTYGKQQAQTMMGAMMVEQLQKNVQDGNLNKVAPDVQRQVIREQLKGTGFENAWIDIEMAMQKETGREDLKKIAEAQGMSADELEAAITSNGYMSVPTETLSQLATSPDILDSVSFTPEADSMARMRVNGKKIVEEYEKNMQKAVERQLKLADTIIDNYIPAESDEQRKKQREVLKAVMLQNLQNPAQGWNELYKIYNDELQEKIGPALEALKKGMGNAGLLEVQDEQGNIKTQRYTENAEWYRNFYKIHKRKPTQAELQDMAIAMTIGDPDAPKVAGWVPDSAETQAAMEQERPVIETLKQNIDLLNSVKAEAKKMTGVEMELTEGLSPEGFKVYRAISSWTEKAGGKIARAGRMTALLWARHADIVADIITKKTGQKYTAEDYIRKHLLLELEKDGQFGKGLNQTQGELASKDIPLEQLFQRAWHGTPYDFEKFDLGAIGTGEGNQVHGWGLYFAQDRKISEKRYRERLAGPAQEVMPEDLKVGGKTFADLMDDAFEEGNYNKQAALENFEAGNYRNKDHVIEIMKSEDYDATDEEIEWFTNIADEVEKQLTKKPGTLFEVEIPDDDVLLDEEKPFSQQPEKVQASLKKLVSEFKDYKPREAVMFNALKDIVEGKDAKATGEDINNYLTIVTQSPRKAAETLNKYGIKGIRYDGGIDGRCFVVFDDKAIEVIEKYNQQVNGQQRRTLGNIDIKPNKDGQRTIHILETANESTFMHEMAHMFLFDLEELAQIDEDSTKQLEIVNKWATWEKGAAQEYKGTDWYKDFADLEQAIIDAEEHGDYETAEKKKAEWRQERFARGFELYLKEGNAPAKGLQAVFRMFKQFLRAIYKRFISDGGKPTETVKRVMDRMIASEEEIEAAALEDRYRDTLKAGGEKLFNEKEEETMKRWLSEEKETAKEKVLKVIMKDLEKEKQAEFRARMDAERERYEKELSQENIFLARKAVDYTKSKEIVTRWFGSVEEFEALDAAVPSMESLVEAHMKEFGDKLDQELIESHLSKEAVDAAMQSGKYRAKMESYILKGMKRKKALINKINAKARAAMDSIEDKLNALPEDIDFKLEATNPAIKSIMQEITRLRFASKWDTADINHIEAMMRASTQQEVRKALKEFKAKQAEAKQDLRDIEEATKGLENFYRDLVKKATEEKPMTETCNVKYYLDKERNAERRVKAMAKIKNWDMAIQQQQQKVFYSMMVKQARKNKEERDKMVKALEKKLNAKTVRLPKDERYWFHQLLYLIRINKNKPKVPEGGVARLEDLFKEQQETLDLLLLPEELINIRDNGENYGDYNQMSLAKFRQAYDDLIRLYTIGRDKFNFKSIGGKSIEEAAWEIQNDTTRNDGILTLTRKIGPDQGGLSYLDAVGNLGEAGHKVAKGLQRYHTSILKPENILKQLGEKAYKYTYGLLEKAAEHEAKLLEKNLRTIQEINSMFTREERAARTERLYDFPGTKGWKISMENILMMAINWGSEQNRQRLIGGLIEDGRMKSDKSAREVQQNIEKLFVETMTEKDWQFIQKLWDYIGSYWHDTAAVEEKLNGVAMGRVENKPFTITTADGKEVTLKGGYMHLRYDPDKSSRAEEQEINDMVLSISAGARVLGMGRAMTKARTQQNIYRELDLHFSVIEQHLYDVIHNIAYRTVLRDVYRLLHYKNYKTGVNLEEYFRNTLGVEAYRVVDTWALDAWRQVNDTRNSADGALNHFFRWVRSNSTMCVMGMRLKPVLDNIGNIPIAMGRIGSFKMLAGMFDFYSNRADNMEEVKQLSAFMRTRAENLDRDLRSQPGTFRAGNRVLEFAREHAYDALVVTDLAVSAPLWKRAYKDCYESKIEEVKKENEENIAKRLELAAKVDQLKAEIAEHFAAAKDIDQYLQARRFGRTNGIAPAQEAAEGNPYAGLSDEVLRAESGNHKQQRQELGKELYKAEQQLEQAQQLPVYDDAEILDEASQRAVFEADSVVRETFGSGRVIDQPAVMRSTNEFVRLFTAFYSFFNAQYNMIYMSYMKSKYPPAGTGGIERWAPLARTVIYNVIFSALLTSAVAYAFGLKGDDKDDKEKTVMGPDGKKEKVEIPGTQRFLKLWAQESLSIGTGGLYGIRDFAQLLSDYAFDGKNYGYKMGSIATRGFTELGKAFTQLMQKGEKDAEIATKEEKQQREHEEKLQKLKGKKRQEYLQKWEEEQKYKKPPKRITYSEILGHTAKGVASFTAARTGITGTMTNAVTGTMQYMFDTDMRYDPTWKNIIWSALFDKKPVEREIPKKPPTEPKKKKKGNSKQSER